MPLSSSSLKAKMRQTIYNGLKEKFQPTNPNGDPDWQKMAEAISMIADDIVNALQNDASVAPGIPLGPGVTAGPGKIT